MSSLEQELQEKLFAKIDENARLSVALELIEKVMDERDVSEWETSIDTLVEWATKKKEVQE